MNNKNRGYKRKTLNLAVKREFQLWLLIRIFGVILLSTLMAVLILYLYSRQEISSSFYSAHIQIRRVSDLLIPVMLAGGVISLLSGVLLALFLPQKIAGPIYRVQKGLAQIADGDLTGQIMLRKNDAFMDLADSVNQTADALRTRIEEVKKIQRELDEVVATLENQSAATLSARQNAALAQLRTHQEG